MEIYFECCAELDGSPRSPGRETVSPYITVPSRELAFITDVIEGVGQNRSAQQNSSFRAGATIR
jgi:hypothetical protein